MQSTEKRMGSWLLWGVSVGKGLEGVYNFVFINCYMDLLCV